MNTSFLPNIKNIKAFTLLELLIYTAILSGVVVMISSSFISLSKGRAQAQARGEVNSALRFSTERIRQDIKNASLVTVPAMGASSSTLSLTVSGVSVVYSSASGQLLRKEGAIATTSLNNTSTVFASLPLFTVKGNYNAVTNSTTTLIQLLLTYSYAASSSDWKYTDTLRTTVGLR